MSARGAKLEREVRLYHVTSEQAIITVNAVMSASKLSAVRCSCFVMPFVLMDWLKRRHNRLKFMQNRSSRKETK